MFGWNPILKRYKALHDNYDRLWEEHRDLIDRHFKAQGLAADRLIENDDLKRANDTLAAEKLNLTQEVEDLKKKLRKQAAADVAFGCLKVLFHTLSADSEKNKNVHLTQQDLLRQLQQAQSNYSGLYGRQGYAGKPLFTNSPLDGLIGNIL